MARIVQTLSVFASVSCQCSVRHSSSIDFMQMELLRAVQEHFITIKRHGYEPPTGVTICIIGNVAQCRGFLLIYNMNI